jgi:pimeloyl-ACP methyl ester carboxylesterase
MKKNQSLSSFLPILPFPPLPSFLSLVSVFIFLLSFAFVPSSVAYAETRITSDTLFQGNTVWNSSGSPYILDSSITIPSGDSLSIGPGVTVTASSTPDNPISIFAVGTMNIVGTADEPVVITGLDTMTFSWTNVSIAHADINVPDGIEMFHSTTTIASSTIHGARDTLNDGGAAKAISLWGSNLTIAATSISDNDYGIYSYYVSPGPFLSMSMLGQMIFGQTVLADTVDDPKQNYISISGSDIMGNGAYGIYNATSNVIHAENNWWGNATGPNIATSSTANAVYGLVDTAPWLTKDPLDPSSTTTAVVCCSNVLFLPGIEASRLYSNQNSTDKLWEPLRNADVQNLFMTTAGTSVNPSIYANGIIDSAYGFGIYNNFIAMMNNVVHSKTINAWEPFAYDWRFGVDSFLNGGNSISNTNSIHGANNRNGTTSAASSKLLSDFLTLASSSKTGKVTIVAHSDGGLLAKMLAKTLADSGKASLIDKMVMVAVPELGTPQAIVGLLHGDGEDILDGLILGKSTARELGDNAPGAYGLLPSKDYFSAIAGSITGAITGAASSAGTAGIADVFSPIISFAGSTSADFHFAGDGQTVSTYDSLRTFLAGIADHRQSPAVNDGTLPTVLSAGMIDNAQNIHSILDSLFSSSSTSFSFSSSTKIVSLIGVGNDTVASLHYFEQVNCPLTNTFIGIYRQQPCTDSLIHTASTTIFGDGTVVAVSAKGDQNYYFNLFADNKGKIIPDSHVTILNSNSGVAFVKDQVIESTTVSSASPTTSASPVLPPYITDTEPTLADFHENNLIITMHSPVDVNVYDSQGRHTGPIPNPDPTSDLGQYEENIPGSTYDPEAVDGTSVTVPYGTDYSVILNGTGSGSFTLDTEHEENGVSVASTEFADMPVTPLLKAELILATTTYVSTTTSATSTSSPTSSRLIATTSQLLVMDFDGDGVIDATSTPSSIPGGTIDPTAYLRSMERTIKSFGLSAYRQKVMCDKIDKIISYILAKKQIKVDEKAAVTAGQALSDIRNQHWIFKNLDQVKKDRLTDMFQSILDSVDI